MERAEAIDTGREQHPLMQSEVVCLAYPTWLKLWKRERGRCHRKTNYEPQKSLFRV